MLRFGKPAALLRGRQAEKYRARVGVMHALVRANAVWRSPPTVVRSVVVFQGPQAYVTPSWYPSKVEHGKTVPTWNYAVVHARGAPAFIHDRDWLMAHVSSLTDAYEAGEPAPLVARRAEP